jgi:hypothetical protein
MTSELNTNLLAYLKQNCRRKSPEKVRDLAWRFNVSERKIRATLAEFNEGGYPVATATTPPMGVYWAGEASDLDEYWSNLNSRALKILGRMRAVNKAKTREFIKRQGELFL